MENVKKVTNNFKNRYPYADYEMVMQMNDGLKCTLTNRLTGRHDYEDVFHIELIKNGKKASKFYHFKDCKFVLNMDNLKKLYRNEIPKFMPYIHMK